MFATMGTDDGVSARRRRPRLTPRRAMLAGAILAMIPVPWLLGSWLAPPKREAKKAPYKMYRRPLEDLEDEHPQLVVVDAVRLGLYLEVRRVDG